MRAVVTEAPRSMQLRDDVPEPGPPGAGEVVVRPQAVGICGSDFHFYAGELHELVGATMPRVQGHEVAATIEAVGPDCRAELVAGGSAGPPRGPGLPRSLGTVRRSPRGPSRSRSRFARSTAAGSPSASASSYS